MQFQERKVQKFKKKSVYDALLDIGQIRYRFINTKPSRISHESRMMEL